MTVQELITMLEELTDEEQEQEIVFWDQEGIRHNFLGIAMDIDDGERVINLISK